MIRHALFSLLILVLLVSGVIWKAHRPSEEVDYYTPEAFVQRANRLIIEEGLLKADCSVDPIRLQVDTSQVSEADRNWYERSYLKNDVDRFNTDPLTYSWTFLIDEACTLLGVNPVVHTIQLPFLERRRWLGNLYLSGSGADASLRSAHRALALRQPLQVVSMNESDSTPVGDRRSVLGEVVSVHFGGGQTRPAGRFNYVGDTVVLNNQIRTASEGTARLLGHPIPPGRGVWLESGDWLHFLGPNERREETFIFTAGEERDAISVVRQRNERFERSTDDDPLGWIDDARGDEPIRMLDGLVSSLSSALGALPEERGKAMEKSFDLQLTLDRELQGQIDRALSAFSQSKKNEAGIFSAGVTVLDGKSGDLLALATYPHPEHLTADVSLDPRRRRRLLLNQNLIRHPIGSAGKPFFFAAVAETHPAFLKLVLDAHPEEEKRQDLLQCRLRFGYQVLGSGLEVDFERALEASSNRYTVELAFLALAAESRSANASLNDLLRRDEQTIWPKTGQSSGLRLGDRRLDFAPDFSLHLSRRDNLQASLETTAVESCLAVDRMDQLAFRDPLSRLTGVPTFAGEDPELEGDISSRTFYRSYSQQRYDLGPFRPLVEHLLADEEDETGEWVKGALQVMAPERVNLAFNHVNDLRLDYISMLLGGANSIWTNIQLAESAARLVTNRPVEARLISEVLPRASEEEDTPEAIDAEAPPPQETQEEPEPLLRDTSVRTSVLRGMERVVFGGSGTATALRNEFRDLKKRHPNRDLRMYSKTGSPTILIPVARSTPETLTALMNEGLLILEGQTLTVGSGDRTAYQPRRARGRAAFERAVERAIRKVRGSRSRPLRSVLRQFDRFQSNVKELTFAGENSIPEEVPSPLMIVGQQLRLNRADPLFAQRLEREKGAVYFFTLVSLPKGKVAEDAIPNPAILAEPGTRVISVALHIDVGPDSKIAVAATETLLPLLSDLMKPVA